MTHAAGDPPIFPWPNYYWPTWTIPPRVPHKCPVCKGKGILPCGFYSIGEAGSTTTGDPEQCRPCIGTGVIYT